jgi:hypothetical protein
MSARCWYALRQQLQQTPQRQYISGPPARLVVDNLERTCGREQAARVLKALSSTRKVAAAVP